MSPFLNEFLNAISPEAAYLDHLRSVIQRARSAGSARYANGHFRSPNAVFQPLLLGYNGASNTGADVRVIEMLRQFRHIFGHVAFDPVLLASGSDFKHPELDRVRKLDLQSYFPDFLSESLDTYTGVIACEGSMFTSTFSETLSGTFSGGIGYATAIGHLGIGYGAEAAAMSPALEDFTSNACANSLIISRNRHSQKQLHAMGIRTKLGADPAWTFEPEQSESLDLLIRSGWNGKDKIAVLCPINPFCWPVVIDVERGKAAAANLEKSEYQRDGISFHSWMPANAIKYDRYLDAFSDLVHWLRGRQYFVVQVGMQDIDGSSCSSLNQRMSSAIPTFIRGACNIDQITGMLHRADLIATSRFHAALIGMSARTPCIGISMDSRIDRLFSENDLGEWLLSCDTDHLGAQLIARAANIANSADELEHLYATIAAKEIRAIEEMGMVVMNETLATYSGFPECPLNQSWDAYLPPLAPRIDALLNEFA